MKIRNIANIIFGSIIFSFLSISCSNFSQTDGKDALTNQLHQIDSIYNSGQLIHLDVYEIGDLSSDIDISVESIDVGDISLQYIDMSMTIGGAYSNRHTEHGRLLPAECKYLLSAIDVIKENLTRTTNHEERYVYVSKDDIRIGAYNSGGKDWWLTFYIDYRVSGSWISLTPEDLDTLKTLINKSLAKIDEIKSDKVI